LSALPRLIYGLITFKTLCYLQTFLSKQASKQNIFLMEWVFEYSKGHPTSQTKDNKTGICCFSVYQAELRRKSIEWLTNIFP
jgi:hypothetical protein